MFSMIRKNGPGKIDSRATIKAWAAATSVFCSIAGGVGLMALYFCVGRPTAWSTACLPSLSGSFS